MWVKNIIVILAHLLVVLCELFVVLLVVLCELFVVLLVVLCELFVVLLVVLLVVLCELFVVLLVVLCELFVVLLVVLCELFVVLLVVLCELFINAPTPITGGQAVTQLVEALRYKPRGRGFDSQSFHCNFALKQSMALGSTQPLTEVSTRDISRG